jgi:Zn-dependent peptidase ImmA (M78 family)
MRQEVSLLPHSHLPAQRLAQHLDVILWTPESVAGLPQEVSDQLLKKDPDGWSALSFEKDGQYTVIYNPSHKSDRQTSDIMHELAHIIIGHEPSKMILSIDGSILMRSFDQKQEDEATWLGGCLILPREALLFCKKNGASDDEIRNTYNATASLLRMRMGVTGISRHMSFIKSSR